MLRSLLKSLFNSREEILRNCTTYYCLFENIWSLQISGRFKGHLNMTILTMSA